MRASLESRTTQEDIIASRPSRKRARALVLVLTAVALLARILICWVVVPAWEEHSNVPPSPDAYPQLALSLLRTGTLGFGPLGANPTTTRGPGFPLWLSLGIVLGGEDVRWLAFWGSVPSLVVGCFVVWLLLRRYGAVAAAFGALAGLLHPLPMWVAGRVLGDDFAGAFGMLGLLAYFEAGRHEETSHGEASGFVPTMGPPRPGIWTRSSAWTVVSGLALALLLLTRSTGLLIVLGLILAVLLVDRRSWRRMAVVLAIAMTPAVAWSIRSSRLEGRPVVIQSLVAYNFWLGEGFDRFGADEMRYVSRRRSMELIFDEAGLDRSRLDRFWWIQLTPAECADIERRLSKGAWVRIRDDPFGYAGRVVRGLGRFWFAGESAAPSRIYFWTVSPLLLITLVGIMGLLSSRSRHVDPLGLASFATLFLTMLAFAATIPMARYSVEVYPELAYLAGLGAAVIAGRWRQSGAS